MHSTHKLLNPPEPGAYITERGWAKKGLFGDDELLVALQPDTVRKIKNHLRIAKARATQELNKKKKEQEDAKRSIQEKAEAVSGEKSKTDDGKEEVKASSGKGKGKTSAKAKGPKGKRKAPKAPDSAKK